MYTKVKLVRLLLLILLCFMQMLSVAQDSTKPTVFSKPHMFGITHDATFSSDNNSGKATLTTLEYSNKYKVPYTVRVNVAGRFGTTGMQLEADAYPKINKKTYAYINGGVADDLLFPQYRGGLSLFRSMPASFEVEGGFRLLHFNSTVWIYTASVSKYHKRYLFNMSTFLTPENGYLLRSYFLKTRYYLTEKSYLMLTLGTGISPDDKQNANQLFILNRLRSKRVDLSARIFLIRDNVIYLNAGFMSQQTAEKESADRINVTVGYHKVF